MHTADLFDFTPKSEPANSFAAVALAGVEFDPARDSERLTRQVDCIRDVALEMGWTTIQKLTAELRKRHPRVGFPENSVQAQLRNLRKIGFTVERRHVKNGLFEYQLLPPSNPGVGMAPRGDRA